MIPKVLTLLPRPIPHNIKLVIFDLDGTLVDAYQAIADSINWMLRKTGYPQRSLRMIKRSVGWGVDSLVRCFVPEDQAVKALALFREHHDKRLRQHLKLLPGAKTLLSFLKSQGCVLAIASNRPEKFCRIILDEMGIENYFDHIICGDMVRRAKPNPDMLQRILRQSGCASREAVFVGDMTVDIECGKAAGVFAVAVPTGSCSRQELLSARPDRMIRRISEVRVFFHKPA